jgi:hypothetical protein
MGVGFRWRETRRVLGILRMRVVLVVSAHHRPTTWGLTYNDGKVQAVATFELAEKPHGTEVTFVEDVEDLQGKPKRAERMLKMMQKQDGDLLDRLKAHVEATSTEPAGLALEPVAVAAKPAMDDKPAVARATKAAKPTKAAKSGAKTAKAAKAASKPSKAGKSGKAKPAKKR